VAASAPQIGHGHLPAPKHAGVRRKGAAGTAAKQACHPRTERNVDWMGRPRTGLHGMQDFGGRRAAAPFPRGPPSRIFLPLLCTEMSAKCVDHMRKNPQFFRYLKCEKLFQNKITRASTTVVFT